MANEAKSIAELTFTTDLGIQGNAIRIVSALLAVAVVRGIDHHQQRLLTAPSALVA